jgi:hypothetical protein
MPVEHLADRSVSVVIADFLDAAEAGDLRGHSGGRLTRAELRELRAALAYVAAGLGTMRLRNLRDGDVEELLDRLDAEGLSSRRIIGIVGAVHALRSYALEADRSPTHTMLALGAKVATSIEVAIVALFAAVVVGLVAGLA